VVKALDRAREVMAGANHWQARHRWFAVPWAVQQKFSTDQANMWVVALGWYGFLSIYPLLLVVVTTFGFIGVGSLGASLVGTLHHFPVIGPEMTPGQGGKQLHGSVFGLVVGTVGLVYGAQGVTQTAQAAMNRVWNVPQVVRPGFAPRLARSLAALVGIGVAFFVNALAGALATGSGRDILERIGIVVGQLILNVIFYLVVFRLLLAPRSDVGVRALIPGAVAGAVFFTALITIGTGLVEHQLRNEGEVYGAFASVIGVVVFLLLLAKLSMYAAELNPVLARGLYPRALPLTDPLPADLRNMADLAHEERRVDEERVGVGFDPNGAQDAYADARRSGDDARRSRGGE
jgi:uncharacterized BrkB/YihY/UPF0761 family membrane protein